VRAQHGLSCVATPVCDPQWPAFALRMPIHGVVRGQQRSPTSPGAEYPQISINSAQALDRRPNFQTGAQM
jgi:hypothetical protein